MIKLFTQSHVGKGLVFGRSILHSKISILGERLFASTGAPPGRALSNLRIDRNLSRHLLRAREAPPAENFAVPNVMPLNSD